MLCPFRNFFTKDHRPRSGQPYSVTLRKGLEPFGQFRALLPVILLGEGLSPKAWNRLIERKTRLVNVGSSMKPRKAQVKDKGLRAESGDFRLEQPKVSS